MEFDAREGLLPLIARRFRELSTSISNAVKWTRENENELTYSAEGSRSWLDVLALVGEDRLLSLAGGDEQGLARFARRVPTDRGQVAAADWARLAGVRYVPEAVRLLVHVAGVVPKRSWPPVLSMMLAPSQLPTPEDEVDRLEAFWDAQVIPPLKSAFPAKFGCQGQSDEAWVNALERAVACELLSDQFEQMLMPAGDNSRTAVAVPRPLKRGEASKLACLLLLDHPEWTVKKIAKEVGCHHSTLYRNRRFQKARELAHSNPPPRGHMRDGVPEAYSDDS